jgi:hypothetical protein
MYSPIFVAALSHGSRSVPEFCAWWRYRLAMRNASRVNPISMLWPGGPAALTLDPRSDGEHLLATGRLPSGLVNR